MNKNNGGPAFPSPEILKDHDEGNYYLNYNNPGMTLRDYFAAKAMQGFLADLKTFNIICEQGDLKSMSPSDSTSKASYKIADAMLKERNK